MSYHVTNENSFLDIKNAHLRVTGNVHTDVLKLGAIEVVAAPYQPTSSEVLGTTNFTNVTTGVTTSSNLIVGGVLSIGTVEVIATTHTLANTTAKGSVTPHTIEFSNVTTGLITTANVSVGRDLTVTGNVLISDDLTVTGNALVSSNLTVAGNVSVSDDLTVTGNVAVSGTGAILVPSGTTAQQPTGINGMIRYNSTTGYMEAYTVSGWGSIATPPTIQTFSPTSVAVADVNTQVFAVTGAFFDAITNIQLQGSNGTKYDVTDFTFTNSGSIGFKMGTLATGQAANRPFHVVVTNGAGLSITSSTTLNFGAGVTWTSPAAGATLTTFSTTFSSTITQFVATDDLGGSAVTYSVAPSSAALPSGLTLTGSTGAITGQIGAVGTTSVTFRATDNASGATLDRTFSIVGVVALYAFTSPFTFTNAGATGRNGPTLTNLTDTYTPAWTDNPSHFNVSGGIQQWTVSKTGSYRITAAGASARSATGGDGAIMRGDFTLTSGEVIRILVGQSNYPFDNSHGGKAGAGGTFVVRTPYNTTVSILVIAGGGGGGYNYGQKMYSHGRLGTSGGPATSGGAGGTNGGGGVGGYGQGGAGFSGNGGASSNYPATVAQSFLNGGVGAGSGTTGSNNSSEGGFGGGGMLGHAHAGGGGGYSGGGGSSTGQLTGGGGGSYNAGSNQVNIGDSNSNNDALDGSNTGQGYVIIEAL